MTGRSPPTIDYARAHKSDFPGPLARLLMLPTGWPTLILVVIASLFILWQATIPGGFPAILSFILLYGLLGLWWFLRLLTSQVLSGRYPMVPRTRLRPFLYPLIPVPIVFLLCAARIPARVAFLTARPTMAQLVPVVQSNPASYMSEQTAGLLRVRPELCSDGKSVIFIVPGSGFFDERGYGYRMDLPANVTRHHDGDIEWRRLSGNWFRVYRSGW